LEVWNSTHKKIELFLKPSIFQTNTPLLLNLIGSSIGMAPINEAYLSAEHGLKPELLVM
jgi:hypothetical protein